MKEHFLTLLRMKSTDSPAFRLAASQLSSCIAKEIGQTMPLKALAIDTPIAKTEGLLFQEKVILVPVLRAGLAMLSAFLEVFPKSAVGFLGIRRDEKEATPHLYYENLPEIGNKDRVFLLDPMLATGGTASLSLKRLAAKGANLSHITLVSFLASKEGLAKISKQYPEVHCSIVAIDPALNQEYFIVPGLGDFGNRYFGI